MLGPLRGARQFFVSNRTGLTAWYLGPQLGLTLGDRFSAVAGVDIPILCPNGAVSSSPGLARLGPTLGLRGDSQLPQRGCGKLLPRGCRHAVALGNDAVGRSTQRGAACCGWGVPRRPQPRCGCSSLSTLTQGRPAGPVAQTFQSAGCGDFPVPTFGPRNWKVPRTRRLESLRYEAAARANPGLEDTAPLGQSVAPP